MRFFSDDYLMHHGIPGQRWGVRRYQNSDGSLTPAGQKRMVRLTKKVLRAKAGIRKNNEKIEKLNSYSKSRKNARLELKRSKKEIKREKLAKLVNEARKNRELYDIGPTRRQKKALKKAYKLDTSISKINRKQTKYKRQIDKIKYKNMRKQRTIDKSYDALNDLFTGNQPSKKGRFR